MYTARSVYNLLKNSEPVFPEDIGAQLGGLSTEYVNQIILALQKWGINIKSTPTETVSGRPKVKYTIDINFYYILISHTGFEVQKSSASKLNLVDLIGTYSANVEKVENELWMISVRTRGIKLSPVRSLRARSASMDVTGYVPVMELGLGMAKFALDLETTAYNASSVSCFW